MSTVYHQRVTLNIRTVVPRCGSVPGAVSRCSRAIRHYTFSVRLELPADEMFLALVSMIQVTRPALLKPAGDGFDVDVSPLLNQKDITDDERLVLRLYGVLSGGAENPSFAFDLTSAEASRLSRALSLVESSRQWPADAVALSRKLRTFLNPQ